MNLSFVYLETQGRTYQMKALDSCGPRIHDQHPSPLHVADHLQYMRMSAYEYVRSVSVYQLPRPRVITARIASYMGHQHLQSLAFEETMEGMYEPELMIVAVARDTQQRLESPNLLRQIHASSEVPCVPYLVNRLKEVPELRIEDPMRI